MGPSTDPEILLLAISPEETAMNIHKNLAPNHLWILVYNWKHWTQAKCSSNRNLVKEIML
jgi:hypothetical protein